MTTRGDHARNVQPEDLKEIHQPVAVKGEKKIPVRFGNSELKCSAIQIVKSLR
jgi:hypothetical protein